MSWVKKRGQNTTPAVPPPQVQMYNPNQHSNQENQWQPQQQQPAQDLWYNQQANQDTGANYWQQPYQQNYNQNPQQYGQYYQNNGGYQQQNYGNLQYNQQLSAQNYGAPVQPQEGDGWGSNWGWGDEDNSNIQTPQINPPQTTPNTNPPVANSFTNDETWNWSLEEASKPNKTEPEIAKNLPQIDRLTTNRNKLETPQWSMESQMSQESSDDILQTSESDKSRMLSRSSTISHSPISGMDNQIPEATNFENKEILAQPTEPVRVKSRSNLPHTQTVNLETLPDNSEQPDALPPPPARKTTPSHSSWLENNEAPINDRNQYLETAQLSDVDLNNFNRPIESQENDTLPPPGLRRMVPGQLETSGSVAEPPEGLRRMVPGESSSPENARRNGGDDVELTRSATIGADTPPVVVGANRSETIGADAVEGDKRRDSIEGEGREDDVGVLVNSVRNLTVGDDEGAESGGEGNGRSSEESEREVRPKTPERRERRHRDKDERGRTRYSPDDYRDKKHDKKRYKDKRYEEDTDYYSDKEKERRHKDEREYDRKYSSLRKDKEKEKERRRRDDRREYPRDPRKTDYYYGRYEDYENEPRSRASSRSDSMHDTFRDRDRGHERDRRDRRHRDKDRHRRPRDPFNPYQGFGYDIYSQYQYQQYQYYENLRKTNPQAYAQLYRKYYQSDPPYVSEDRASVHSGRSSANDELAKDSYSRTFDQPDNSLHYEDPQISTQRLTPAKFATAHLKASITSGKLVKILPHYPLDGQAPIVELCNLESLLYSDEDYQELKRFPGPLVKGTTHKKTIIEYCENKIKSAKYNLEINDHESYVLMWELLILLIRQNGMVVGADISELLLKNRHEIVQRPPSAVSSVGSNIPESAPEAETSTNLKEEEITNKFREYLVYGSVKEGLEWAMKHGLWGHALFLASKLDKRTYANVLMRFANGLAMNDPLQTLYQLLSGRTPAAVTCVADEKWGDWRPHLAMILSNSSHRPDLNCKAITLLGDTLMARGSLYAAQFCYLMAEVAFGQYGSADAKLVLLGSNHNQSFLSFATNEAIHMTEIYEYARSLNDAEFTLATFQRYKYLLATRLADVGLLEKALSYLEKIAHFVVKNPSLVEGPFIDEVAQLSDRLKYYDPIGDGDEDSDFGTNRVDNSWLNDLRRVQNDYNMGLITQETQEVPPSNIPEDVVYNQDQSTWQQPVQSYEYQQQWNETTAEQPQENNSYQQQDQQYWQSQQQWNDQSSIAYPPQDTTEQSYYGSISHSEEIPPQPQISLPNQKHEEPSPPGPDPPKQEGPKTKPHDVIQGKQSGSGWFGGIFSKLSLKPKNQMKLPDDKNPTIVWDSDKKRWINTDGDGVGEASDFKPPPKMAELAPKSQPPVIPPKIPEANGNIPKTNQPNMFKLQRNRNLKKSYIDVFNPSGKPGAAQGAPLPLENLAAAPPMNFFIPQPVNDPNAPTDFLTPAPPMQIEENSQRGKFNKT